MSYPEVQTKQRILVVDDEPHILDILVVLLTKHDFEIKTALDGTQALELINKHHFDAIVCDYMMPNMDGITLIRRVRDSNNLVPFIFLSGVAGHKEDLEMASKGAYQLMAKMEILKVPDMVKKSLRADTEVQKLVHDSSDESKEFVGLLHSIKL